MSKTIINQDAVCWLKESEELDHIVTAICDMDECKKSQEEYKEFFENVAFLAMTRVKARGYCIFIQTDRKVSGTWIDKSYLLNNAAQRANTRLLWHKIVLLREPGSKHLQRPTYSHMMCFSKEGKTGGGKNIFPDVIPVSKKNYSNGTPIEAAKYAIEFIKKNSKEKETIVDIMAGRGTICNVAIEYGFNALGIDINEEQCIIASSHIQQGK